VAPHNVFIYIFVLGISSWVGDCAAPNRDMFRVHNRLKIYMSLPWRCGGIS
jgi:hypothetical protein